jgi:ABC-type phosphate/phosphonate transport system substrate-binding protein
MASLMAPVQLPGRALAHCAFALMTVFLISPENATGQQGKIDTLHIGTSGALAGEKNEKNSLDTLRGFIKDETGLESEITRERNWRELAVKMAKGQYQVGVFQGFEYAWAKEKYPDLKPLAVAVNVHVYPVAYVVTRKDGSVSNFAGLQGRSLGLLADAPGFLRLFVERECQAAGKKPETFFSKIVSKDNFEDALDDVVDGVVDAAVVDRAALENYKLRKPGRFAKLKPVAQSQPFPPAVVAYYGNSLNESDRNRFRDGLLGASGKEKGQTMLTLFRLTGFQAPPADFDKVLAKTREAYPPDTDTTRK